MTISSNRNERFQARLQPELKELLSQAARLRGLSLSDFVLQAAQQEARRTLEEQRRWVLAEADAKLFVETLLQAPAPSEALLAADQRSRKLLG